MLGTSQIRATRGASQLRHAPTAASAVVRVSLLPPMTLTRPKSQVESESGVKGILLTRCQSNAYPLGGTILSQRARLKDPAQTGVHHVERSLPADTNVLDGDQIHSLRSKGILCLCSA
jgi:hypothetical protein